LASGQLETDGGYSPRAAPRPQLGGGSLYTPEQRRRRDQSRWTLVQGILAPIQFFVFLGSLALVLRFFWTGQGAALAEASILLKTGILYLIMITGSIWEKVVFDEWLFAGPFFWEDVVSMLVMALHTGYVAMLFYGLGSPADRMLIALAAYASYVINAAQFLYKLRRARLDGAAEAVGA
jgi:3-vinyl bacteriochlorophyllide hydratase